MSPQALHPSTVSALSRLASAVLDLGEACNAFLASLPPVPASAPTAPPAPSAATPDALAVAREEGFAEAVDAAINALYELPTVDGEQPLVTIVRAREAVRALRPPPLQGTFNIG